MPKILDYPRGSLKSAVELADAVDALGGETSMEMAADKLGRKISGAFSALASSASKYGLVETKAQRMSVTVLYRNYKLAYSPEEEKSALRTALLKPPIYKSIVDRFADRPLPIAHFEKLLEREFGVPNDWASRVASYFIDGAREVGLLGEGNTIVAIKEAAPESDPDKEDQLPKDTADQTIAQPTQLKPSDDFKKVEPIMGSNNYTITITGPGINTSIRILDMDDFAILQATLRKVEKAISIKD